MYGNMGEEFRFMGLGWIILLGVMALIIYLIRMKPDSKSAIDILDKRYAKGEISEDEYETKKRVLNLKDIQ